MKHHILSTALCALVALGGCQTTVVQTSPGGVEAGSITATSERERDLYLSVIGQLVEHGKFYAALAHLDEFQRVHGATEGSRRLRGDAWLAVGALDNAEAEYMAIAQGSLSGYGKHGLGRVAGGRADWPLASRYFAQAVNEQPTNTQFLQDYAGALFETGQTDDAEFQLRKALELTRPGSEASEALNAMLTKQPAFAQANVRDAVLDSAGTTEPPP